MKRLLPLLLIITIIPVLFDTTLLTARAAETGTDNPEEKHIYHTVQGTAPTYTQTGLTVGIQCSVCGEWLVEQEIIPLLTGGIICGDVNDSEDVSILDATLIMRWLVDIAVPDPFIEEAADTNGNNVIDITDATFIQRYLASILTPYLIGECISYPQKKQIDRGVNFVGMSIWWYDGRTLDSGGFCGGMTAKGYQTLLKEQFTFNSTTNYCYSGYSLGATAASDAYSIMESAASGWTGSAGDIWTLDTITNDFKRNIPIGTISDYENNTGSTTYYGALRAFRDRVNTLSGSTAIVICSNALRRNNSGYTSTSQNTEGHTLTDYEYALMNVAARNNWYFVDQFRLSGITDDSIALTTLDGLHLNNFGYSLAVKPWIEQFTIFARKLNHTETLTVEIITGSYIKSSDGGTSGSSNWNRTDYIKVTPGKTYRYYGSVPLSATGTSAVFGYDSNKTAVKQIVGYNVDASDGLYFTVPDNVEYIRCSSVNSVTLDVTVPDSTGFVRMAGDIANYYLKSDGTMTNSSGWRVTGKTSPIFVRQGESFK